MTHEQLPGDEVERLNGADESTIGKKTALGAEDTRGLKITATLLAALCLIFAGASAVKLASAPQTKTEPLPTDKPTVAAPVKGSAKPAPVASTGKKRRHGANCLLAGRGAVASGCDRAEVLIDGISTDYDSGYCTYDMNNKALEGCLVTLPKPVDLSHIRFLMYDRDERQFTYIVYISRDGKEWRSVKDTTNNPSKGWQDARFDPQPVKAVRIKGLTSSVNTYFHLLEIQGFDDGPVVPMRMPPKNGPKPSASELKPGLWAEYFDDVDSYATVEDRPLFERAEPEVNFESTPPLQNADQGLKGWPMSNACAAVYSGYFKVDKAQLFTFFLSSDDGSKLYIDGELVIDNDGVHGMTELWGQAELAPGLHRIWVTYFNAGGNMGLILQYKPKNDERKVIPADVLFYDPAEGSRP